MKTKLTITVLIRYLIVATLCWIKFRRFPKLSEFSEGGE